MTLDDYFDRAAAEPWAWGRMDCCFFAGNWIVEATGRDPLAPYRGTYDGALGAARLITAGSGLAATVGAEMERCGFKQVQQAEHGDIAVIDMPIEGEMAVARASVVIRSGPWWVGRTLDGIAGFEARPQAIWRVL